MTFRGETVEDGRFGWVQGAGGASPFALEHEEETPGPGPGDPAYVLERVDLGDSGADTRPGGS